MVIDEVFVGSRPVSCRFRDDKVINHRLPFENHGDDESGLTEVDKGCLIIDVNPRR